MARYLKLFGLFFALWVVTPFAWLERALTGGRELTVFERILAGTTFLGVGWTTFIKLVYVPHFAVVADQLGLRLPWISEALIHSYVFQVMCVGLVATTLLAMRVRRIPDWARVTLLIGSASGAFLMAQLARLALAIPFFSGGCPHG